VRSATPNDPVRKATEEARELGAALAKQLDAGRLPLIWADTDLVADKPQQGQPHEAEGSTATASSRVRPSRATCCRSSAPRNEELIIISPYFVPGERGVKAIKALIDRGVRVRVLTNSLAATDAAIVHIGYSKYRKAAHRMGVEINELRPDRGTENMRLSALGSSKASLHASP